MKAPFQANSDQVYSIWNTVINIQKWGISKKALGGLTTVSIDVGVKGNVFINVQGRDSLRSLQRSVKLTVHSPNILCSIDI